jgi:hypothetical protein
VTVGEGSRVITPPDISADDLRAIVPDRDVGEWRCEPLSYYEMNPVSGGVYRVNGDGWSVVLKVLRHPAGGVSPMGNEPLPAGWGDQPSHYNYWLREADVFADGSLSDSVGIRAPRVLGTDRRSDDRAWLWFEDVPSIDVEWTDERFRDVARRLGKFNGSSLAPRRPSRFLRGWVDDFSNAMDRTDPMPELQRLCPGRERARLFAVWDRREYLLDILDSLPRCFAHLDAFGSNVLFPAEDADPVLVDWAFAGSAAVGEEIVQLGVFTPLDRLDDIGEARRLSDLVFGAYLEGLDDAGVHVDADEVLLAYTIASALRWGLASYRMVRNAVRFDAVNLITDYTGRSLEDSIDYLASYQDWALEQAETAFRLAARRT